MLTAKQQAKIDAEHIVKNYMLQTPRSRFENPKDQAEYEEYFLDVQ